MKVTEHIFTLVLFAIVCLFVCVCFVVVVVVVVVKFSYRQIFILLALLGPCTGALDPAPTS